MLAPMTLPPASKSISTNFPNLLELSFRTVFALPKASKRGFDSSTCKGNHRLYFSSALSTDLVWRPESGRSHLFFNGGLLAHVIQQLGMLRLKLRLLPRLLWGL
jgi:hypothetical protein